LARVSFIEGLGGIAARFAERKLVRTLNTAFVRLIPFITIGAIALAILNLPIPILHNFISQVFDGALVNLVQILIDSTLTVIALAALTSVSMSYTLENRDVWEGEPNFFIPAFTSFSCFIILFVWKDSHLDFINVGTNGIFKAIFVGLFSLKLLFTFIKLTNRGVLNRSRSISGGLDANLLVQVYFAHILPVALTLISFVLIRATSSFIATAADLGRFYDLITSWMQHGELSTTILVILFSQIMAFTGAHNFVLFDLLPSASQAAGTASLFSLRGYYLHFGLVGGSGATIGLLLALAIVGKKWYWGRSFARVSVFPVLFNINEPLLYGFPVILNPFYVVPFIIAPLVSATISFLAFQVGLVPLIVNTVDWTTPPLLSGYLATGSLAGTALQAVCIAISALLYYPFVRAHHVYEQQQRVIRFQLMQAEIARMGIGSTATVFERQDAVGQAAREIAVQIKQYIRMNRLPFYMVYQPKTDRQGRTVGSEALLRWQEPELGAVSPITIVGLMNEMGLASLLGRWVIEYALRDLAEMRTSHLSNMRMSINLEPRQLIEDKGFVDFLRELRDRYVVLPGEVELEITENVAVNATEETREIFRAIRDMGIGLAIDDLGMGYSSLNYISDYGVSTVKVDRSLIESVATDMKQREIVRSVVQLSEHLRIELVVEGVETEEQATILDALGVRIFQGYNFSRPLIKESFKAYLNQFD